MRSNQASRAEMTTDGGLLSESAVKPRRSANSSAASIVSPMPRRKRAGQHPRGAASTEIGFERRIQRGSRGERGEGRGREARRLMQPFGVVGGEEMRRDPSEPWPVRFRADKVFMHGSAREALKPAPARFARLGLRSRRRKRAARKP